MSESDTMFNEWDRRCAAVQLMLSTDPSYDSQNNRDVPRGMKTNFWLRLWSLVWFQVRGHIMPPHIFEVGLKVNHQSVPGCTEECGDPLVQSGGRWQTPVCGSRQVQRDPGLASEGVLRLCTLLSLAPSSPDLNPLDYFVWSYVENITNMTSHNTKASLITAILRVFAQLPPALVKKASSQFRICIEAVIEAEGSYIIYFIIKLPELIFQ